LAAYLLHHHCLFIASLRLRECEAGSTGGFEVHHSATGERLWNPGRSRCHVRGQREPTLSAQAARWI